MPVRKLKPRSPGVRSRTISGFEEITKSTPEKSYLMRWLELVGVIIEVD